MNALPKVYGKSMFNIWKFFLSRNEEKWFYQHCIRQKSQQENGISCLAILLSYVTKHSPKLHLKQLRRSNPTHIKINDCDDMKALLEMKGFRVSEFNCAAAELAQINLPCLIQWRLDRFAVLFEIEDEEYFVLDPASERVGYKFSDFECHYCEQGLSINN